MNIDSINTEISLKIKTQSKLQGLTQKDLAEKMNVSLATVKRWYKAEGLSIASLHNLSKILSFSLSELFDEIENKSKIFQYSLFQERFFAKNPDCLAYYDLLLKGFTKSRITKKYNLSSLKTRAILLKLDKAKLIELLPNDRVKVLLKGEPVWRIDGPLVKRYKREIISEYFEKLSDKDFTFYLHDYLEDDLTKIKSKIEELKQTLSLANKHAGIIQENKKSYGVSISLKEFKWRLDQYLY